MHNNINRLNLGSGLDFKEGYCNVDFNREVKADLYINIAYEMPFADNSVEEILLDNTLEHIENSRLFWFLDELWRCCKNGAIIKIWVPHDSSLVARTHLAHHTCFGIGSFDIMLPQRARAGERYNKARFNVLKEELQVLYKQSANFGFFNPLVKPLDWFFNLGGRKWKKFWEKFNVFGFEEIYYELRVVK